jgi:hypothetical protein
MTDRFPHSERVSDQVFEAFRFISSRFRLLDASQFSLQEFNNAWKCFYAQLEPLQIENEWDTFRRLWKTFSQKSRRRPASNPKVMTSSPFPHLVTFSRIYIYAVLDEFSMSEEIQTLIPAVNDCLKTIFNRDGSRGGFSERETERGQDRKESASHRSEAGRQKLEHRERANLHGNGEAKESGHGAG